MPLACTRVCHWIDKTGLREPGRTDIELCEVVSVRSKQENELMGYLRHMRWHREMTAGRNTHYGPKSQTEHGIQIYICIRESLTLSGHRRITISTKGRTHTTKCARLFDTIIIVDRDRVSYLSKSLSTYSTGRQIWSTVLPLLCLRSAGLRPLHHRNHRFLY